MAQERSTKAKTPPGARKRQRRLAQHIKLLVLFLTQRFALAQQKQKQKSLPHTRTPTQGLPLQIPLLIQRKELHAQPHTRSQARHRQSSRPLLLGLEIPIPIPCAAQTQLFVQPIAEPVSFSST